MLVAADDLALKEEYIQIFILSVDQTCCLNVVFGQNSDYNRNLVRSSIVMSTCILHRCTIHYI